MSSAMPIENGLCFACSHNTSYPNQECYRCQYAEQEAIKDFAEWLFKEGYMRKNLDSPTMAVDRLCEKYRREN